ncbi:hypothetical protein D3C77_610040 [compost metagenome]
MPFRQLLLITCLALLLDARQQRLGAFQLVGILRPPFGGQLALEGVLEQGLTVDLELLLGGAQVFHALVEFGEQLFEFGDDALLLGGRRQQEFK